MSPSTLKWANRPGSTKKSYMYSKPINAKVIIVLALAIVMAWAVHTSGRLVGLSQPAMIGSNVGHMHDNTASPCITCADHYHSSLTADHVHEIPYLATLPRIVSQPKRALRIEAPRYSIPASPVFLIERPPRSKFVL